MDKMIASPGSYIQGRNLIQELGQYYKNLGTQGAYILVDPFVLSQYQDVIEAGFSKEELSCQLACFGGECSMEEIKQHQQKLEACDVIIGIGGGKTLDTAKAVAFYAHLPVMIVPTIASTDAPCSRLSVVYTPQGEFERYLPLPANPNIVLMDTEIICKAPVRFLIAGIGDTLATSYEAEACQAAHQKTMAGRFATNAAMSMARLCHKLLLSDGEKAIVAVRQGLCTPSVEVIIEANTYLSGIGFESGGLAAAHAIHNGLTSLPECHAMLHGEKVAFGTITQLVLENKPLWKLQQIITFCNRVGLPTTLQQLGLGAVGDDALMNAAKLSCAQGETIHNMPFTVTPYDVFAAMKTADQLAQTI